MGCKPVNYAGKIMGGFRIMAATGAKKHGAYLWSAECLACGGAAEIVPSATHARHCGCQSVKNYSAGQRKRFPGLDARRAFVLKARSEGRSFRDIAAELGVTHRRARQIAEKAAGM